MESSIGDRLGTIRGGMRGDRGSSFGTKIGRLVFTAAALILLLVLLPSTVTYINPGHVGILIHRAGGGVDPNATRARAASAEPDPQSDRGVPGVHADARVDAREQRGLAGQRRDQRQQRGRAADLARRVHVVRARPDACAGALPDVPHGHRDDPARVCEAVDSSGAAGGRGHRADRGRHRAEEGRGGEQDAGADLATGSRRTGSSSSSSRSTSCARRRASSTRSTRRT